MQLLEALKLQFPQSSRRTLQQWLKWGRIAVDGTPVSRGDIPYLEDQKITLTEKETRKKVGPLTVVYEDRYCIVIVKPENLLSVPSENPAESHVLGYLKVAYRNKSIFPVHRLDRECSGLLVFARGKEAEERFKELFEKRAISREYLAIVEGYLSADKGKWESHLQETESYDVIQSENGKLAITHFQVYRRSKQFSYLLLKLETGRKHQIRVHCNEAGHPIVGDRRYGSLANPVKRLCLHAYRLSFNHPYGGKQLSFIADLPKSFRLLGADLDFDSNKPTSS